MSNKGKRKLTTTTDEENSKHMKMVCGNQLFCSSFLREVDNVKEVIINGEEKCVPLVSNKVMHDEIVIDIDRMSIQIGSLSVPTVSLEEAFSHKCSIFISVMRNMVGKSLPEIIVLERPRRDLRSHESDDEDDEADIPIENEIKNPFAEVEFYFFQRDFQILFKRYRSAKLHHFQNAQGKKFFECVGELARLNRMYISSEISTHTKGDAQPGATTFEYIIPRYKTKNSASNNSHVAIAQFRVADFVIWDEKTDVYHIVGEIKSDDKEIADNQCKEQMLGLFSKQQKIMLGLIIWPSTIQPIILRRSERGELEWNYLTVLPIIKEEMWLSALAKLYIGFIHMVKIV